MSDLFISEVLILLFLLPVFLRAFSKSLKSLHAILFFPLFALILCILTIAGQGIYFSNFIILVFSIIAGIFTVPKLVSYFNTLNTAMYSSVECVFCILFLLCTGALFFLTWKSVPYRLVPVNGTVLSTPIELENFPKQNIGTVYRIENTENQTSTKNELVILLPNRKKTCYETNTVLRSFLQNGYTVLCIENFESLLPLIPKNFYNFSASLKQIFYRAWNGTYEEKPFGDSTVQNFLAILNGAIDTYGNGKAVYVFSDGVYTDLLLNNYGKHFAQKLRGAFVVYGDAINAQKNATFENVQSITIRYRETLDVRNLNDDEKTAEVFFYEVPQSFFPAFGDMTADDIVASTLLGATIDTGRTYRTECAATFQKWIRLRAN